jgi:hypothetical protein
MKINSDVGVILSCIAVAAQSALGTSESIDPNLKAILTFLVAVSQGFLAHYAFKRYPSGEKLFNSKKDYYDGSEP